MNFPDRLTLYVSRLQLRKAAVNLAKLVVAWPIWIIGFVVGSIIRFLRFLFGALVLGIEEGSGVVLFKPDKEET